MKGSIVKAVCMLCFCLVLLGATIKTYPKEYNQVAGPFVSSAGGYIYDVVEEAKNNVR